MIAQDFPGTLKKLSSPVFKESSCARRLVTRIQALAAWPSTKDPSYGKF